MKRFITVLLIALCAYGVLHWYNRHDNGIHGLGKNVALIEGECIVINWDATENEAELALCEWQRLKILR